MTFFTIVRRDTAYFSIGTDVYKRSLVPGIRKIELIATCCGTQIFEKNMNEVESYVADKFEIRRVYI